MQDPKTGLLHEIKTQEQMQHAQKHHWPIFEVGEIIELKGGRFRVAGFGAKILRLEGLPGTTISQ